MSKHLINDDVAMDILWKLFEVDDLYNANVEWQIEQLCLAMGIDSFTQYSHWKTIQINKKLYKD